MRALSLLVLGFLLLAAVACVPEPITPIPVIVQQYPNTWTPEPTGTNTPLPPTATLVIQRTAGPAPTRDPNARRVPVAPRGGMGVWLDVAQIKPESLPLLAPRAQVFVENNSLAGTRSTTNYYFLQVDPAALPDSLSARYDGVVVTSTVPAVLAALQAVISPRLVIAEMNLSDAAAAAPVLATADGICFCNFLRDADAPRATFKTEAEWIRDIDTLAALTTNPETVVFTATRFPAEAEPNFDELQLWLDYAASSFLMGVNNTHAFFGFQGNGAQEFLGSPAIAAKLGAAQGAMFKSNGVYQRRFTNGLVLVNPTLEPHTVPLSKNYATVTGGTLTQADMPAASGMILLNAE